jgi:uncharacterized protein YllA (UPF0747 family)
MNNCAEIAKSILKEANNDVRKDINNLRNVLTDASKNAEKLADKLEGFEKTKMRDVRNKIYAALMEFSSFHI